MAALPLLGTVVGVTADRRSDEQILLLERAGARALHGPTIRTLPLADHQALEATTRVLLANPPAVVVLTTGIGARGWFSAAAAAGLDGALQTVLRDADLLARGPKAAGAAVSQDLEVHALAETEQSAELVDFIADRYPPGVRVAVQLDGSGQHDTADALRAAGADVVEVAVYRWTQPVVPDQARRLIDQLVEQRLDAVTFTSSPALVNLMDLADRIGRRPQVRAALAGPVAAVCVGPVCAATARSQGVVPAVVPERSRLGAMVDALVQHLRTPSSLQICGELVELRQTSVVAGDRVVELSARERAVLDVLASRPGAVISRDTLGRVAWPDGRADDHTIAVTVSRLRRRLGRLGVAVETSPRRGYRLVVGPVS